jgi:hypothetical protein
VEASVYLVKTVNYRQEMFITLVKGLYGDRLAQELGCPGNGFENNHDQGKMI